jgi:4'-phosphopantetheinyl transferase
MSPKPDLLWPIAAHVTPLGPDEVQLWGAWLDDDLGPEAAEILSPDETARAQALRFERDRRRFVNARVLLRRLLAAYIRAEPAEVRFAYGAYGKPALAAPASGAHLQFNLSHSGALALYAVSRCGPVGVDLEQIRELDDMELIATQYFSATDNYRLQSMRAEEKRIEFFRLWTQCEALGKGRGVDLDEALRSQSLDFSPMSWRPRGEIARETELAWSVTHVRAAKDYLAAVATGGAKMRLNCRTLPERLVRPVAAAAA